MMVRLIWLALLPALALWPASVRADAIDGAWCHTEHGRMVIQGPRIETVTGRRTEGDYGRHSFQYVVPSGDPGAGATIAMVLMGENLLRLRTGGSEDTWRRCGPPTS